MSFKTDFVAFLEANVAIGAAVGDRIYSKRAPMNATGSYAVWNRVSGTVPHNISTAEALSFAMIQVDMYTDSPTAAETVEEAFRNELDGYAGTMGSTAVRRCRLMDERDDLIDLDNGDEDGKDRIMHEYEFVYVRAVPTL